MNQRLQEFEDAINAVLNDPQYAELEIAEVVGVLQIQLHVICQLLDRRNEDSDDDGPDPADYWKRIRK